MKASELISQLASAMHALGDAEIVVPTDVDHHYRPLTHLDVAALGEALAREAGRRDGRERARTPQAHFTAKIVLRT